MNARAVLLALCFVGAAAAAHADDDVFVLQMWQSPSGLGLARTVGPMSAATCEAGIVKEPQTFTDTPPDMSPMIRECTSRAQVQMVVGGFHCAPFKNVAAKVKGHPEARLWLYSCWMRS
jgi:hypothetical protein